MASGLLHRHSVRFCLALALPLPPNHGNGDLMYLLIFSFILCFLGIKKPGIAQAIRLKDYFEWRTVLACYRRAGE